MFCWYDYLLVFLVLFASTMIGIYFGCFGSKQSSIKDYLSGGKQTKILPIALSVTVSHFSGITLIGVPADVYKFGAFYIFTCFSAIFFVAASIYIYYPVLFNGQYKSIYEYLEARFDQRARLMGSLFYILSENLTLPVVIYSPALALSVGINVHIISLVICGTCVFYTAVGGLRTVIWTDIFQFIVVMTAYLTVCVHGTKSAGGVLSIWNTALSGQRLDIFDFDPDPTKKDSVWLCTIGLTGKFLVYIALSQASVQKYLSLSTIQRCKRSLIISALCWCLVNIFAISLGLIIFATYYDCDPVMDRKINKYDQIVAYYVEQVAKNLPGISGLFMAALLSSAISTLSSSLNALSGVIYNDFVKKFSKKSFTETSVVSILKLIVVIEGLFCTCMVFIIQYMDDILSVAIGITGLVDGPSLGLITLGILFSQVNATGAFYGAIAGMISVGAIYFPSFYYKHKQTFVYPAKPLSNSGCNLTNETISFILNNSDFYYEDFGNASLYVKDRNFNNSTIESSNFSHNQSFLFYRISYNYYCIIGALATIIVGLVVSFVTNCKTNARGNQTRPVNVPLLNKEQSFRISF